MARATVLVLLFGLSGPFGCGGGTKSPPSPASTETPPTAQTFATEGGGIELSPPPGFPANGLSWQLPSKNGKTEVWIKVEADQLPTGSGQPLSAGLARNPDLDLVSEGKANVGSGRANGIVLEQKGPSPGSSLLGQGQARHVDVLYDEGGVRFRFTMVALESNIDKHRETFGRLLKSFKKL